jgi:uroporphyrinogen-III decarboxylase
MTKAQQKRERVLQALRHEEPDRVPIHEWFSTEFVQRWTNWRKAQGDKEVSDINEYYDLDMLLIEPNIDPHIQSCEIIERTDDYVIFKSGFGCTIKKVFSRLDEDYMAPMPQFLDFSVKSAKDYVKFELEDPADQRRYFGPRQDIISGDGFTPYPSFMEAVRATKDNFCLCGGVCEPWENLWRIRGPEEAMIDLVRYPQETKAFIERLADFSIEAARQQVKLAGFKVMYVWGDVAFKQGMLFSPQLWRELLFPALKRICAALHDLDTLVIYHGCGNNPDFLVEWFMEAGIDALNPLEVKAGMDVLHLKQKYGQRLALNGGIDNSGVLSATTDREVIKRHVLTTLNAAKGGGYILMSDHSIPGSVPPENYDYLIQLAREYGNYPLRLGAYDLEV